MSKNFSLFLALRYLKPKRTFVSIITLISVVGVSLGVAVLILVISVMAGFEQKIKEVVLGFEPHIAVEKTGEITLPFPDKPDEFVFEELDADGNVIPRETDPVIEENEEKLSGEERERRKQVERERGRLVREKERSQWEQVKARLEAEELILEATPYVEGRVLMEVENQGKRRRLAPVMRALGPEDSHQVRKIRELMEPDADDPSKGGVGELNLRGDNIVMSRAMARNLKVHVGDIVTIISPKQIEFFMDDIMAIVKDDDLTKDQKMEKLDEIGEFYKDQELRITGLFDSLRYEEFVIIPLTNGQELYEFELTDDIHGLAVHTEDAYGAAKVEEIIGSHGLLTANWKSQTWMDKHKLWFDQIRNERAMMYFVLFFIVIVAAFSIMNTMITVTVQKRKEIGVMKALGAREGQIIWVFLAQGIVVGVVGTACGVLLGYGALEFREPLRLGLQAAFGLEIFPEGLYGVPEIPVAYKTADTSIICVGAIALCTLAALLPAWFAARLDPAKALRE